MTGYQSKKLATQDKLESKHMTESTKVLLDKARLQLDHCAKVLKANEILWNDRWKAQPNPFAKINDYTSEGQRARRKPIIDAWIQARDKYDELNNR